MAVGIFFVLRYYSPFAKSLLCEIDLLFMFLIISTDTKQVL